MKQRETKRRNDQNVNLFRLAMARFKVDRHSTYLRLAATTKHEMKTHLGDTCSMYYYGFKFLEIFFMNCAYEILSSLNIVRFWCSSSFNIHKKQKRG